MMAVIYCGSYCEEFELVCASRKGSVLIQSRKRITAEINEMWLEVRDTSDKYSSPYNSLQIKNKTRKNKAPRYP